MPVPKVRSARPTTARSSWTRPWPRTSGWWRSWGTPTAARSIASTPPWSRSAARPGSAGPLRRAGLRAGRLRRGDLRRGPGSRAGRSRRRGLRRRSARDLCRPACIVRDLEKVLKVVLMATLSGCSLMDEQPERTGRCPPRRNLRWLLVQRRTRGPLSLVVGLVVGVSTLVIAPAPAGGRAGDRRVPDRRGRTVASSGSTTNDDPGPRVGHRGHRQHRLRGRQVPGGGAVHRVRGRDAPSRTWPPSTPRSGEWIDWWRPQIDAPVWALDQTRRWLVARGRRVRHRQRRGRAATWSRSIPAPGRSTTASTPRSSDPTPRCSR